MICGWLIDRGLGNCAQIEVYRELLCLLGSVCCRVKVEVGDPRSLTNSRPYRRFPFSDAYLFEASHSLSEIRGIMFGQNEVSDKELVKTVSKRLQRGGGGGVTAAIQRGTVTLKGKIQYETQRRPILKIVNCIAGVRNVIDQLQLEPRRSSRVSTWGQNT